MDMGWEAPILVSAGHAAEWWGSGGHQHQVLCFVCLRRWQKGLQKFFTLRKEPSR